MADQTNKVDIISWPKESAKLEHEFKSGSPCELSVKFKEVAVFK